MVDTILQNRDYTVIFAKTAVKSEVPPPGYEQRWANAQTSILNLLKACEDFAPDGITLYVACESTDMNCEFKWYEHVTSEQLPEFLATHIPPQAISLKQVLQASLDNYFARKAQGRTKANGEIILVILDGEPQDRMAIAKVIVNATQQMDKNEELGIGLVQVGDDPIARGFFTLLDDHLQEAGAQFDIVTTEILDTIPPDALTKFLIDTLMN
ncbi:MAG: hypothetical protein WBA57_25360 [Elainellaceae cyanobacterium]